MAEPEKHDNEHGVEGIDELVMGFMGLEREVKDAFFARIMKDDLHEETKRTAVAEAIENTSGQVKQNILADAVKAAPPAAKKAAVAEAVETTSENADKAEILTQAVRVAPSGAKKAAVAEAVSTTSGEDREEILTEAVKVAPSRATRTAVVRAVENAPNQVKQDILADAVKAAPLAAKKAAVAEAVETSEGDEAKQEVLTEAVRIASPIAKRAAIAEALWALPLQAKKELTVGAMYGMPPRSKKHLARAVVAQLGQKDQYAVAREYLLDERRAERERLLIISTFALVFAALTVGFLATVLWKPDSAQDMAAVFMGIAGALGGFVGGRATGGGVSG